jgi:Flp pilus assembly CpaE family ATPase
LNKTIAVWSPKPGDGASFTADALAQLLWEERAEGELIGLLDCNTRTPWLKYRLGLDECVILDELLPLASAGCLTPEILCRHAGNICKKESLHFIGGIRRPEFNRYSRLFFDILLDISQRVYTWTVLDAGNIPDQAGTVAALQRADYIITVLQPSYVSKQSLRHCRSLLTALEIDREKMGLVYNRYQVHDEEPQLMAAGLDYKVLGTLNELGREKNLSGYNWLFVDRGQKTVAAYRESLKNILEKSGLVTPRESKKKGGILPKLFARGA